jgi:hypothetical protein
MKASKWCILFFLAVSLAACQNDDPDPVAESTYFVVHSAWTDSKLFGSIATYAYKSKDYQSDAFAITGERSEIFMDFTMNSEFGYGVTDRDNLIKISLSDFTAEKSIVSHSMYREQLHVSDDKVIVGSIALTDTNLPYAYLKFYDHDLELTDSTSYQGVSLIYEFKVTDQYICLSVRRSGLYYVFLIDADAPEEPVEIELGSHPATEIIQFSDHQILVITGQQVMIVNSETFEIEETLTVPSLSDEFTAAAYYALDPDNKLLYHYSYNSQPAPVPLGLSSLDLETGEITDLTDFTHIVFPPIAYDAMRKLILTGTDNGIAIFNPDGYLVEKLNVDEGVQEIIIH